MAVQAGRAALGDAGADVHHVVFVTRDLPLLEGGNGAALSPGWASRRRPRWSSRSGVDRRRSTRCSRPTPAPW